MASPAFSRSFSRFGTAALATGFLGLVGCQLNGGDSSTLLPDTGTFAVQGLAQNVSVRRNPQGMALIESSSFHDALFTLGYIHAGDRIVLLDDRVLHRARRHGE